MSRILLVGNGPLPFPGKKTSHNAVGLRTLFFSKVLALDGHEVEKALVVGEAEDDQSPEPRATHYRADDPLLVRKLRAQISNGGYDAVVAVNNQPSGFAAKSVAEAPLWCDLNGWLLAEAQSHAWVKGSDVLVPHRVALERAIVSRADRISTVSGPQRFATLGELALLGRLNSKTDEEQLVVSIPNHWPVEVEIAPPRERREGDPFTVFFCGGYNTWLDPETLFAGLELAMDRSPAVCFVSTGGAIAGMGSETLQRFTGLVEASKHRGRFRFLGWIRQEELAEWFALSDVGINVDRPNSESEIGARNRINEMLARGLPVVTSRISEISRELEAFGAAACFPPREPVALGELILELEGSPSRLRELRDRGLQAAEVLYGLEVHTGPLRRWAANPRRSGDAGLSLERPRLASDLLLSLRRDGLKGTLARLARKLLR